MTHEEILVLKIAELMLHRDSVDRAALSVLRNARKAGRSGAQKLVLTSDLTELDKRCAAAMTVDWPPAQRAPVPVPLAPGEAGP